MVQVLHRLAWMISITFGILVGFLIADIESSTYSSGAENWFEWGWIFSLGALWIMKGIVLSRGFIESYAGENTTIKEHPYTAEEKIEYSDDLQGEKGDPDLPLSAPSFVNTILTSTTEDKQLTGDVDSRELEVPRIQEPEKPNWLIEFFSDRPLAKIGGILLFLGALFFLSLIWTAVGPIGKIFIGLLFGFFLYGLGVWMDKKGNLTESRTLLGVGIAINTLTILSGRWMIGGDDGFLGDGITLFFLFLNTLLGIVTALVYSSRTFLVFSFVFAYLIPFLVGTQSDTILLSCLYIVIVSIGGYMLSYVLSFRENQKDDAFWLFRTVFIGSFALLFIGSFSLLSTFDLIVYLLTTILLLFVSTFLDRKTQKSSQTPTLLFLSYILLTFAIFSLGKTEGSPLWYIFSLIPLFGITVFSLLTFGVTTLLLPLLFFPIFIGSILFFIFGESLVILILLPILILYGIASFFILDVLTRVFQYLFFFFLGCFMLLSGLILDISPIDVSSIDRSILASTTLIFFCFSLFVAFTKNLDFITLFSVLITSILFAIILSPGWGPAWIFFGIFLAIGFTVPFIAKSVSIKLPGIAHIGYQVILNIFMVGELTYLGKNIWFSSSSTSLITLGVLFFIISILSTLYTLSLITFRTGKPLSLLSSLSLSEKNLVYSFLAIPLSLFSLSIAVIFSDSPSIVSAVWILESTILAFLYGKIRNTYILSGSLILLFIGLIRLIPFFDDIGASDWFLLFPLSVIGASLFVGVKSLVPRESVLTNLYDILHIIGIIALGLALMEIIPHTSTGWSLFGASIFLAGATLLYTNVDGPILSRWLFVMGGGYFIFHLGRFDSLSMEFLPVMIQILSLCIAFGAMRYFSKIHMVGRYAFFIACVASIFITSLYVNEITDNVFMVTIYLTFVSTVLILFGIQKNLPHYRTAGLYIGVVVLFKILFYDLWIGVDNLIIRVVALMVSGGVMIALSQLYGKSVNRTWSEEFSWTNFSSNEKDLVKDSAIDESGETMPFSEDLAGDLKTVDISGKTSIRLRDTAGNIVLESKRAGLIRVASYIIYKLGKNDFIPGELRSVYTNVLPHIRSSLAKKDLETLLLSLSSWIEKGGTIEILPK